MPAGLPGDSAANNLLNPSAGRMVIFDLLSGPKGSPFDRDDADSATTGALSTGIGFGSPPIIDPISTSLGSNAVAGIRAAGFSDDYQPGITNPDGTASTTSVLMYLGGGKSNAPTIATYGAAVANPYVAGYGIGNAGNGGSRDAGAGPAFTGFTIKTVTATGAVINGAAVEAGWINRSGVSLVTDQSVFGSNAAASAVVA